MLNIVATKITNVIKQYLVRARFDNRVLDVRDMKSLREKTKAREPYLPLSGNYRLEPFDPLDLHRFNAELDMVSIDSLTITDFLTDFYQTVRERILLNEIYKNIYTNKIRKVTNDAVFLTSDQFIAGFTTEIDFKANIDQLGTDADTSSSGIKLKSESDINQNPDSLSEETVRITVDRYAGVPDTTDHQPEIIGKKSAVLDNSFSNGVQVKVYSLLTEQIGVNFKGNVNLQAVNSVTIFLEPATVGQFMSVTLEDPTTKLNKIFEGLVTSDRTILSFSIQDVRYITVSVYQKLPSATIAGIMVYPFGFRKIKFGNTVRKYSASAVTKPVELKTDTKFLSLISDEYIPDKTSIVYSVSYDMDSSGNPINFFSIIPTTRPNQNKAENFIRIGSKRFIFGIAHNTQVPTAPNWSYLTPDKTYGGKLYSIANISNQLDLKKVTIAEDSIKLYRGINDWSVIRSKLKTTELHEKVSYFPIFNPNEQGYEPLPIYIQYDEELIPLDSETFELSFKPNPITSYKFTDGNLKPVNLRILDFDNGFISGKYRIKVEAGTLIPGQKYNLKYYINLDDITDKTTRVLRTGSRVYTDNADLLEGTDYNIIDEPNRKRIVFIKSGNYRGEKLLADFLVEEEELTNSKVYTALVQTDKNITIDIGPFNKSEIEKGNFHKINGEDVSVLTSFSLSSGKYLLQTTQPYVGINQRTGLDSAAFISVPKTEVEFRGYEESLRKVPVYELVLNSGTDDRQFAFLDGKIFLNRVPDYPAIVSVDAEGKFMKTIALDDNNDPFAIPEAFRIEFDYEDGSDVKSITLKIDLANSDRSSNATPEVRRLGLNQYNTDPPEVKNA